MSAISPVYMGSISDWRSFDDPWLDALFERALQKSELTLEYDRAANLDDLFIAASKRVCLAAYRIMSSFRIPKRGLLILRLMKRINRSSYNRYWVLENGLMSECLIFIAAGLREFVNSKSGAVADNLFLEQMTTWAGMHWYRLTKMSSEEIASFQEELTSRLIDFEDNPPSTDLEHHSRIRNAIGRKPHSAEIAKFAIAVTMRGHLALLEPEDFVRNYQRLCAC